MLNDSLESVQFRVDITAITIKELFAEWFSEWLYFDVEQPLHVFKSKLPNVGSIWWVTNGFLTSSEGSSI
jgi:hypothetical protein